MGKQVKLLLCRPQGLKLESIWTSAAHRDSCPVQMFFISPVKGERVQPLYMMESNIAPAVQAE